MGACISKFRRQLPTSLHLDQQAEPTDAELDVHTRCTELLTKREKMVQGIAAYESCDMYIRNNLSTPTPENADAAWQAVSRAANALYKYYRYTLKLDEILGDVLSTLCNAGTPDQCLRTRQATINLLTHMFWFAIQFDSVKMSKPAIQNDFSYYRRALARMSNPTSMATGATNDEAAGKVDRPAVNEDTANKMSFHYAYPVPVMKVLTDRVTQLSCAANCIPVLALASNVCSYMLTSDAQPDRTSELLSLMTGSIIFVDHLLVGGVFQRRSPIAIKQCVTAIVEKGGDATSSFINEIRFSAKHLKDPNTPQSISNLFR